MHFSDKNDENGLSGIALVVKQKQKQKTDSPKPSSFIWRAVCSVGNCRETPRHFGPGKGDCDSGIPPNQDLQLHLIHFETAHWLVQIGTL